MVTILEVEKEVIDLFYKQGFVEMKGLPHNANVVLKSGKHLVRGRARKGKHIERLYGEKTPINGILPLNGEQAFALDLLLRDDIPIVAIEGSAGCGKSILSISTALHKRLNEQVYRKILIVKPVIPIGRDIGHLPGSKDEKLLPWMKSVADSLEIIAKGDNSKDVIDHFMHYIEMDTIVYMRGRSLHNTFVILDESQNLTRHEIKTVLSRLGEGSKAVVLGDLSQIDVKGLERTQCGLHHVMERLKGEELFGSVTLLKSERSAIARLIAEKL